MIDKSLFKRGETIAVALSGGMDSICLLHLLNNLKEELEIKLVAVNVDHGIRGDSSKRDSQFVFDVCKRLNVPLKHYDVNVPEFAQKNKLGTEEAARILRYQCFDNALIGGFCDKIATAHHSSDQVETVLFNLFRGSSLKGVCGMAKASEDQKYIRPLLSAEKEQILAYVKDNNLEYVEDESNQDQSYTRNFIRNTLLPAIEDRFPAARRQIERFSLTAAKENELLEGLSDQYLAEDGVLLAKEGEEVLFKRACLTKLKQLGFKKDFESVHLDALYNLCSLQVGARICLKDGLIAFRSYQKIIFLKEDQLNCEATEIPFTEGVFSFGKYTVEIKRESCFKRDEKLYLDADKLPYNAIIRTKRTGDTILSFGGTRKSLKRFLTDKKIESRISRSLPVIAADSEIYAVLTCDVSALVKVEECSKNIFSIKCLLKGDNDV